MGRWLAALLALATPLAGWADEYQEALAAAARAGAAGRHQAAADLLAGPAAAWPQDAALQLTRAWHLLRAGRYEEAAAGYRAVLALAPGSEDARRGLDDARALRGARDQVWLGVYGAGSSTSGSPTRTTLGIGAVSADAVAADRWTFGGLYRLLVPPGALSSAGRGAGAGAAAPVQQEGHLSLGYAAPAWGLTLHGAAISRSATTRSGVETVHGYEGAGAALSAWLVAGLEWRAAAAVTWYEDQPVLQVEGTGALALGDHLALRAGWRGQRLDDGSGGGAALAGLEWRAPWSASLTGELGAQRRPWDLANRTLYDLPDRLLWAARAQASFPLVAQVRGWLAADLERWRAEAEGAAPIDSTTTRLAAGLVFTY